MYHCHLRLYLAGRPCRAFEIMKEMTPLEHFTHEFSESSRPDGALAAEAGAIFVNLQEMEIKEALDSLIKNKSADAELILLVDRERLGLLEDSCWDAKDIWMLPASDRELRFRFLRWQQTYKTGKDFWETSHFLDKVFDGHLGVMLNAVMDSRPLSQADLEELSAILEKAKGEKAYD